ncbi:pilus assembly protein [Pectobacterium parmentieri]|uniref:Fimbrial protein n=1 Tax=Pectobacterium parmentieri TaxID=1905730 RepID=A0A0H3I2Q1_PECPM|nr:fimbrial protein [Pectobacterium parmentieri]AFI89669.1 Putative minor fimbrial subunit [Pectobacterium parmentieri]MBI0472090.1 fimbrial protein [Pectobacterium parmentieri]MBI0495199.1 fimbrial protein [Pectobacterium parmentieri]MBI0556251.1 fimbrial protein [Pectobacterium parmentieri]MBI0569335.1 fimbrial protein [Pectobacterium parmentieri]
MKIKTLIKIMLLAGLSGCITSVMAGEGDMTFRGTLITPPPCIINDGNQISVNFGERIGAGRVNGVNYRMPVNYQITCEKGNDQSVVLTLRMSGSATDFDPNALQTNKDGLGIRIYQNDEPFAPNSTLKVSLTSLPKLEAVPVKKVGGTLEKGSFETWATLRADYQ